MVASDDCLLLEVGTIQHLRGNYVPRDCVNKSVAPLMHATNSDRIAIPIEPVEWMNIDAWTALASLSGMKPRQATDKVRPLDPTRADREVAALKQQFRREDLAELAQGRGAELTARNRRLLGIREGVKGKLVGFNGVCFE